MRQTVREKPDWHWFADRTAPISEYSNLLLERLKKYTEPQLRSVVDRKIVLWIERSRRVSLGAVNTATCSM